MKKLLEWIKIKKFNLIDAKITALCGVCIGLLLAKWININIIILIVLIVLSYSWIVYKVFKK